MENSKSWYQSTTIQNAILGLIGSALIILEYFGLIDHDTLTLVNEQAVMFLGFLMNVAGLVGSIYGRTQATTTIQPILPSNEYKGE